MTKWDTAARERMLVLILENYKVDAKVLAKAWAEKYGAESPTVRAIEQIIPKIKGTAGRGKEVVGTSTPAKPVTAPTNRTPQTPKHPMVPKTPTSSAKRKRGNMSEEEMSDGDDSEPDVSSVKLAKTFQRRASLGRTGKAKKRYVDVSDDEDDEEAEPEATNGDVGASTKGALGDNLSIDMQALANGNGGPKETQTLANGNGESKETHAASNASNGTFHGGQARKRRKGYPPVNDVDSGDDSDGSNFSSGFA